MTDRKLPVIYVRGFAGKPSGIDQAIDDPLYGFNAGSVHIRVGSDAQAHFYQFEGPLLRLIHDEGYQLPVHGNQRSYLDSQANDSVSPATIWVHRFYDSSASTLGYDPTSFDLVEAAKDLFRLVRLVQAKTGAPRVFLIAHSMGGLICRSLIQRVIPEATGRPDAAIDYVDRLFTYGTPHGGIQFAFGFGLLEKLRDTFDIGDAAIFGPDSMYQYLTPDLPPEAPRADERPEGWSPTGIPDGVFPRERVFCLIGTNPEDYEVAWGLSAKAVGVRSDGLVQIDNAYVPGASHAFVHRSHSGRYGLVNSEEGYQNLWRFLFGDLRVTVELVHLDLPGTQQDDTTWQLDVQLAVRGLPILMHEQTAAHHCPIQLEWSPAGDRAARPQPLLTTFLASTATRPASTDTLRYALHLRLMSSVEQRGQLSLDPTGHLEQTADFDDTLIVDVQPATAGHLPRAWAKWSTDISGAIRDWQPSGQPPLPDLDPTPQTWRTEIALPSNGHGVFGRNAGVQLTLTPWT
jgi:hypothetical protein